MIGQRYFILVKCNPDFPNTPCVTYSAANGSILRIVSVIIFMNMFLRN